jgi:hypothetical protein
MKCPYKFLFGIPEKGFHSKRFMGVALFDTLGTVVIGVLIAVIYKFSIWKTVLFLFVLGEVLHYLFGTQTAFLTMMGINACPG